MVDLTVTQLLVIGGVVVIALGLIVYGLRRGSLKKAELRAVGVRAAVEGHEPVAPEPHRTFESDRLKTRRSSIKVVKGATTKFRRSSFEDSAVEITDSAAPTDPQSN
ncbi:hypothetical protein F4556_006330 [Kitasatospora gansuensis]|uniref:Uncharacterized protein n=1 Tax=Kitasatospora gansuensis TaxID=258050 RepID=A0A7W7SHW7_9ACTN|nr:hypothetical protein [Kitasatospora gansuensis]MBB4950795.1 hypothetical protein [Kitasatospora gansuensis]